MFQASVVELLLQHGAKKEKCDISNKTAVDLARHEDVLSLMVEEKLGMCCVHRMRIACMIPP